MQVVIICAAITILLFAAAFVTRRRFGLLGLALAAGSILSGIWGSTASLIVGAAGFNDTPTTTGITLAILVLLPSIVLLFHGATYKGILSRIIGAALFTLLALAFLIDPIGHLLTLQGYGATFYDWLVNHKALIIGSGLILAVVDLFFTKAPTFSHNSKGKH
jgi:hypothetical protein